MSTIEDSDASAFLRHKFIISALPFVVLLIDLMFQISSQIGDRKTVLCLFLALWMVSWWVFDVLPLGITALLPMVFLPILQVIPLNEVTANYANPVIFLFLGGFIIARALEKTHLDERMALIILKQTGKNDTGIVIGFIFSTAFLSMWISNTATTVMMVPIALSVTEFLRQNLSPGYKKDLPMLQTVLFLSIAYSANIGGIMTPIGTPPNVVFMGYLDELYSRNIDFYVWMLATAPIAITLLAIMLFVLKKIFPFSVSLPKEFPGFIQKKLSGLGRIDSSQKITMAVFFLAALLWIFKGLIHYLVGIDFLNDTSIAVFGGLLLFLIPKRPESWSPVLDIKDINKLPWDIVLLFGGGMALAAGLKSVGLIETTTQFFASLELSSSYWLIFILAGLSLFLTEIMSNVALCVVALPLIMKLGESQGIDPLIVALPAALCSSFAFSMPISTPPNAIVFGTNTLTVGQMLKAGALLNLLALILTMTLGYGLITTLLAP